MEAAAPHSKRAARALHRTAPSTTAVCPVPPLLINCREPKWLHPNATILESSSDPGFGRDQGGWPRGNAAAKLPPPLYAAAKAQKQRETNDADSDLGPRPYPQSGSGSDRGLAGKYPR